MCNMSGLLSRRACREPKAPSTRSGRPTMPTSRFSDRNVMPDEDSGEGILYVQHVGSPIAARLQGTEGAIYPFWSPDNAYVAFFSGTKLKKIPVSGGTPQVVANVLAPRGGTWGKKNVIVYAPDAGGPLWRVDADGTG